MGVSKVLPLYSKDPKRALLFFRWAKRGKDVHSNPNQMLFGIVQGGAYQDLREYSAKETVKLDINDKYSQELSQN